MSPHHTPAPDNAMHKPFKTRSDTAPDTPPDTPFDTALRQHLQGEAEPEDDGFSQRVMAALPARALQRRIRWVEWAEHARWTAISLAACGAAALLSAPDGRVPAADNLAAYTLIGLLVFWSVPSRWSRG
jgi:hypothetical protein